MAKAKMFFLGWQGAPVMSYYAHGQLHRNLHLLVECYARRIASKLPLRFATVKTAHWNVQDEGT